MPGNIETSIEIAATAERVWGILMDFASYPAWNPFITNISGEPVRGARLRARIVPPGMGGMTFKPRVLVADPPREFRWLGHLLLPGIADGEHYFRIEASDGGVKFIQGEDFRGILVPLLKGIFAKSAQGFREMNQALKARAEA
jgi:hypothetical protein